jgi:nicotinate-nucleotide pyrophosphorylase (carboxylating)
MIDNIIKQALKEDIGKGDITTKLTVSPKLIATAQIIAKEIGILAGSDVVNKVFQALDPKVKVTFFIKEGKSFKKGSVLALVSGKTQLLHIGERTALNFLCRLSGIATLTRKFVDKVAGTKVKILDTRKTTPNLRILEKYAVKIGGGQNHRFGLYDMILIKDNHIKTAGGITNAVIRAQKGNKSKLPIEVETKNLTEVKEALQLKVPMIMLDNMNLRQIRKAVKLAKSKAKLEVSGGVTLRNVRKFAETGVDFISIGALTHSAPIVDISMKIK